MNKIVISVLCLAPLLASAFNHEHKKPSPTWTGVYIGGNLGASGNNNETEYSYSYLPGNGTGNFSDAFGNAQDNPFTAPGPFNIPGQNALGSALAQNIIVSELGEEGEYVFEGGLQIGFNWQEAHYVVGFEADIQWFAENSAASFSGTTSPFNPNNFFTNSGNTVSNVDWVSTERFRIGYAFDRFLPYLTGGFAFGSTETSTFSQGTDGDIVDTFSGSESETRIGWSAGGGFEYLFDMGFSGRIEGIYYNLGDVTYDVAAQDAASAAEGLFTTASHTFDGVMIRAAVNYKF